ncbi:PilZ domain-containing protein [Candidatus Uabimicrobium sp. HlEnr_7]|uniref:PilZ domain-containing protein n=1 Tax=Candidatus Uabimicrobium helgolandensis TaxID=3095367 RepID=UPI003558B393
MTESDPKERRSVSRIDSINFVSYQYQDEDQNAKVEGLGRTLDISLKGIKLEVPNDKIPKDELYLYIALEEAVIEVRAAIAHIAQLKEGFSEIGIRFENMSRGNELVLEKFLRETTSQDS